MITEDYVSFEVAKLLKEKDFNEKCRYVWIFDKANDLQDTDGISKVCAEQLIDGSFMDDSDIKNISEDTDWFEDYNKAYLCPTLQMALKWLREVHKYLIIVGNKNGNYLYLIKDLKANTDLGISTDKYTYYEEACEAAIKYCLTNLI